MVVHVDMCLCIYFRGWFTHAYAYTHTLTYIRVCCSSRTQTSCISYTTHTNAAPADFYCTKTVRDKEKYRFEGSAVCILFFFLVDRCVNMVCWWFWYCFVVDLVGNISYQPNSWNTLYWMRNFLLFISFQAKLCHIFYSEPFVFLTIDLVIPLCLSLLYVIGQWFDIGL